MTARYAIQRRRGPHGFAPGWLVLDLAYGTSALAPTHAAALRFIHHIERSITMPTPDPALITGVPGWLPANEPVTITANAGDLRRVLLLAQTSIEHDHLTGLTSAAQYEHAADTIARIRAAYQDAELAL